MPIRGVPTLKATLRALTRFVGAETLVLIDNRSREMAGRSAALVPELRRQLLQSLRVTKRDRLGQTVRVISYDTPYAVIRHEDFYTLGPISSQKTPTQDGLPGRKYLERPFVAMSQEIIDDVGLVPNKVARRVRRRRG